MNALRHNIILSVFCLFCFISQAVAQDGTLQNDPSKKINTDSVYANVKTSFIVDTTGKVRNIKILEVDCPDCNRKSRKVIRKEIIRVISSMPAWKPARDKNRVKKAVKVILPVKLKLSPANEE